MWEGKECENSEEQRDAISLCRLEIEPHHVNFLINNKKINEINVEQLGRRCRINKLIPSRKIYEEKGKFYLKK